MPEAAPVTTATFPSNLLVCAVVMMSVLFWSVDSVVR